MKTQSVKIGKKMFEIPESMPSGVKNVPELSTFVIASCVNFPEELPMKDMDIDGAYIEYTNMGNVCCWEIGGTRPCPCVMLWKDSQDRYHVLWYLEKLIFCGGPKDTISKVKILREAIVDESQFVDTFVNGTRD